MIHRKEDDPELAERIKQEEIRNERNINRGRIFILFIILIIAVVGLLNVDPEMHSMHLDIVLVITAGLFVSFLISRLMTKGHYSPLLKYIITTADLFLVTMAILIIRNTADASSFVMSVDTPAFFLLFIVNVLTGMRFDIRLCFYSAILSLFIFAGVTIDDFRSIGTANMTLIVPTTLKGIFLASTAFLSGYITHQAKNLVIQNYREQQHRNLIINIFGRYVSGQVAKNILDGNLELGGEERKVTVLFSDIRDFAWISERLSAKEVVALLNDYFEGMVEAIFSYDGTLDKFLGDGLMALFGAPTAHGNDEERAISAAFLMRDKLREFNQMQIKKEDMVAISVGIGISTGQAVVGNIGSKERMQYTAIGDTINTAARIEDLCKEFDADILVDEATYKEAKDVFSAEKMGQVKVKGKDNPVIIYKIIDRKDRSLQDLERDY